ncbi:hypothetical protein H4S02_001809 [Coemansia sp. RSA 2611]|nr:hypothetical protein H4S01_002232 [Coemansia sp. RSA 2610]KAJ2390532.1 hypothetical protein H4S02_001809 [Coemansia sp. RSA 2611]
MYCLLYQFVHSKMQVEAQINKHMCNVHLVYSGSKKHMAIVMGTNSGIGYKMAKALGCTRSMMILACHNLKHAQLARQQLHKSTRLDTFQVMELDLASFMSVQQFVAEFCKMYTQLNVLVCNAGVAFGHYDMMYDGFKAQFSTNFVGHYMLVAQLLDTLKATQGVHITVALSVATCMVHRLSYSWITDMWCFSCFVNYSTSKLALLMFANKLAWQLHNYDISVNVFHPGLVAMGLYHNVLVPMLPGIHAFRQWLWLGQVDGAVTAVYLALAPELASKTSGYYACEQPAVMHTNAPNMAAQDQLCTFTNVLVKTNTHVPNVLDSINVKEKL